MRLAGGTHCSIEFLVDVLAGIAWITASMSEPKA